MKASKAKLVKIVNLILPPGDAGPICSYSPYCSPRDGSRPMSEWRQATITMEEAPLTGVPPNPERQWVQTWLLQLVRRELTTALEEAEQDPDYNYPLVIHVDDRAADLITRALELKGLALKKGSRRRGKRRS